MMKSVHVTSRFAMVKAALSKKKALFTSKMRLNLRKKPVKCRTWSIALYGAGIWTLWKVDQTYLGSFEMWCWRRMGKIIWTDCVRSMAKRYARAKYAINCKKKEGWLDLEHLIATAFYNSLLKGIGLLRVG